MNWIYSEERPAARVLAGRRLGQPVWAVNAFVEVVQDGEDGAYRFISVVLPANVWEKGAIVNALVRARYAADQMEAVNNNYLQALADGQTEGEALTEWQQMQEWRRLCKAEAAQILEQYNEE